MTCLCCANCEWTLARLALTWSIRSEWNILEPMNFPETRLYTHKCSTFQCAQRYLEKRRNYVRRTSHIAHHTYIRLVVVPGLRIRQRQFYLCWMLFDEFLFIFFFNVSVCGVFFGVSTVSASAYALSVSRLFICLFEMYRNRIGIRIWIRVFWGRSKFVVVAILHLTRKCENPIKWI